MRLQNRNTKAEITVTSHAYYEHFYQNHDWINITPERTEKQIAASEKFVRLGKLHRTVANLEDVIRTFGSHHGIFTDAVIGIRKLIQEENTK